MRDRPTHYAIFGVESTVSPAQLKVRFLQLVKELHPDRNEGDPDKEDELKQVIAAYAVLSDPEKRSEYDHLISSSHFPLLTALRHRHSRDRSTESKRQQVSSTIFRSIGYNPDSSILEVEFRTGAIIQYMDVPALVHSEFMDTPTKGSYYRSAILNRFRERCVR